MQSGGGWRQQQLLFDYWPDANEFTVYEWRICESLLAIEGRHFFVVTHHRVRVGGVTGWRHSLGVKLCQRLKVSEDVGQLASHRLYLCIIDA